MRVIGLTGGIATGKSSVARFIAELGGAVIDADELSRQVVSPGSPGLERLVAVFGEEMLLPDGSLDRKRLGRVVFVDDEQRRRLEQIVHPEIRRLAAERIAAAADEGHRTVFYMAPLLIEAGASELVDEIWVVTVDPEVQLERLMLRDGITREEALRITACQMPLGEKARHGRIVIDNSGPPAETQRLVKDIWLKEIGSEL
ncbi:dephospho-CoA kinase [Geobacter sp. SVR]|uniref:dephospho-CoA kinase n=1 Tax=Geobacter sp. SVR TaxID=2495594 RepID=UPI0015642CA5|nr:dephospho-CoA kinase [Geobacter sp. SVR]